VYLARPQRRGMYQQEKQHAQEGDGPAAVRRCFRDHEGGRQHETLGGDKPKSIVVVVIAYHFSFFFFAFFLLLEGRHFLFYFIEIYIIFYSENSSKKPAHIYATVLL